MFGLILLVCILIAFGFVYVWIANVVAREDVPITKGVIILILSGIASAALGFFLRPILGNLLGQVVQTAVNFGCLTGLTIVIAQLKPRDAVIVAAVFTALMLIASLILGLLAS